MGCLGLPIDPLRQWNTIMAKALAQFSIVRTGEDYLLTIEDQDGEASEFSVDFDQLDLITEAIDDVLDADEEEALDADENDEGEEED
jgi:hypothetical protein